MLSDPSDGDAASTGDATSRRSDVPSRVADPDFAKLLARRTLTNLYNERPTWLDLAHRKLDQAVFAAYGWDPGMGEEKILPKLLELNLKRNAEGE